ncbi:MAG: GNAT family N-acetyltransferase [Defluviitaleaceae bacterium]|nr:GNAT family N-acetyltransferase [Defluviitaleaceae bacterium]
MKSILRKATLNDINLLIEIRIDFLKDGRTLSQNDERLIRAQLKTYFLKHIPDNTFVGIIAESDGQHMGAAYLAISERPANPSFISGVTGTILNVYTYPEYRKKGLATKVIREIIEEAKQLGVSNLDLKATPDGKHVYEKFGFKEESIFTAMGLGIS